MGKENRLVILGDSGFIGSRLKSRLEREKIKFQSAGRSTTNEFFIDLEDPKLENLETLSEGDAFIFLAAISSPEICGKDYDDAYRVNVLSTCKIIRFLLEKKVSVLFASSDVVYGATTRPVDELSSVNPEFEYAEMKTMVEREFELEPNFFVMRLSYVWSIDDKFTRFVISSARNQTPIEIFHPFVRSVISLNDVLDFLLIFVENAGAMPPIVNLAGPEFISRKDLILELSKYIALEYRVIAPDEEFLLYRPREVLMRSKYLSSVLGRQPVDVPSEIKSYFGPD